MSRTPPSSFCSSFSDSSTTTTSSSSSSSLPILLLNCAPGQTHNELSARKESWKVRKWTRRNSWGARNDSITSKNCLLERETDQEEGEKDERTSTAVLIVSKNNRNQRKVNNVMLVGERVSTRKEWTYIQWKRKWSQTIWMRTHCGIKCRELTSVLWERMRLHVGVGIWRRNDAFSGNDPQQTYRRSLLHEILEEKQRKWYYVDESRECRGAIGRQTHHFGRLNITWAESLS
jgi:hypothetical protein